MTTKALKAHATLVKKIRRFCPQVDRVKDGRKHVAILIKPTDVRHASKKDPANCAVARSLRRRGWDEAVIQRSRAWLVKGNVAVRYRVPEPVIREIVSFDRAKRFATGKYQLRPLAPHEMIGKTPDRRAWAKKYRVRKARKQARSYRHRTVGIR